MLKKIVGCVAILAVTSSVFADNCFVVGYHNPNTNVYDGPTFCGNGAEQGIDVNGVLTSSGTAFTGDVTVMGPLQATNSEYQNISIATDQAHLVSTKVDNIDVLVNQGSPQQSVYLNNGTSVSSITFDQGTGLVYVDATSSVGQVTGGTVISAQA